MRFCAHLLFGHADGRNLRHRIDAVGKELRRRVRRLAKGVTGRDAPLLHRRRGKARKADHVADGVDVRHARCGTSPGRPRCVRARRPRGPRRRDQAPRSRPCARQRTAPSRLRSGADPRAAIRHASGPSCSHALHLAVEAQRHAAIAQIVDELVDQFAVDERRAGSSPGSITVTFTSSAEKMVAYSMPITLRADHGQRARQALQLEDLVGVDDALAVERNVGGPIRAAVPTARMNALAVIVPHRAVVARHLDRVRTEEARRRRPSSVTLLRANWCSSTSTSWSSVM